MKRVIRQNRLCLTCGKFFQELSCIIKTGRGKYCSKKCKNESQVGKIKHPLCPQPCKCGCENSTSGKWDFGKKKYPEFIKNHNNGLYGFKKKYTPHNKGLKGYRNTGSYQENELAKNWNGFKKGFTPWNKGKGTKVKLSKQIRDSEQYAIWRKKVFEWDNYRCRICGFRGRLQADHYPFPFAYILEVNNIKSASKASNCGILWDISNGRTLCLECHKKTPTYNKKLDYSKGLWEALKI